MAGATFPDELYLPQSTDELALTAALNEMQNSVQDAFNDRFRGYPGPIYAVPVADAAARDALYPAPVQGDSVFRLDRGWSERYYGTYNATSNPGGAQAGAGWYPVEGILPWYTSWQTGGDNIANATWEGTGLGGEQVSRGGFTVSGDALIVPIPGFYTITSNVKFTANTVGTARGIRFVIDSNVVVNNEWSHRYTGGFLNADLPAGAMWQGYVASRIEPQYYQNSGGTLAVHSRYITARYMGAG